MGDPKREEELARTAHLRGAEPEGTDEQIAMRDAEALQAS